MADKLPIDELLARAVSGDRIAVTELLLPYCQPLLQHVNAMLTEKLRQVMDTEDIVQQTMVAAIRGISQYQSRSDGSLLAWLKTIAENQIRDVVRSVDRQKRGNGATVRRVTGDERTSSVRNLMEILSAGIETPSHRARQEETVQAVRLSVAALPDEQRQAIELHHFEGRSVTETAEALRRTPAAIRGLLHRARQSLKSALNRLSG